MGSAYNDPSQFFNMLAGFIQGEVGRGVSRKAQEMREMSALTPGGAFAGGTIERKKGGRNVNASNSGPKSIARRARRRQAIIERNRERKAARAEGRGTTPDESPRLEDAAVPPKVDLSRFLESRGKRGLRRRQVVPVIGEDPGPSSPIDEEDFGVQDQVPPRQRPIVDPDEFSVRLPIIPENPNLNTFDDPGTRFAPVTVDERGVSHVMDVLSSDPPPNPNYMYASSPEDGLTAPPPTVPDGYQGRNVSAELGFVPRDGDNLHPAVLPEGITNVLSDISNASLGIGNYLNSHADAFERGESSYGNVLAPVLSGLRYISGASTENDHQRAVRLEAERKPYVRDPNLDAMDARHAAMEADHQRLQGAIPGLVEDYYNQHGEFASVDQIRAIHREREKAMLYGRGR